MRQSRKITPKAKRLATELSIDYSHIEGSGRYGEILYKDIAPEHASSPRPTLLAQNIANYYQISLKGKFPDGYRVSRDDALKLAEMNGKDTVSGQSGNKAAFAFKLLESAAKTAPFTCHARIIADHMLNALKSIRGLSGDSSLITLTDMASYAAAKALAMAPQINSVDEAGKFKAQDRVNMSIAIQTSDNGLLAPAIKDIGSLGLNGIASERVRLVSFAESKRLSNDELSCGSFTLSNLGKGPVEYFTPVLNYPQNAILGIGGIKAEPAIIDGQITCANFIYASLTLNHLHLNGQDANSYLKALQAVIEDPLTEWLV
jgi:pyruvate dehydrogenase E2 component (dihydrolipoamide acetyltransferase)